jgi:hypothetical protein
MAKILRFCGIILMGLTAALSLLAGAGTTCVALIPQAYEKMAPLIPYQWLYIIFVLVTLGIGVLGVRATVNLTRGAPGSYRDALIALAAGLVVGIIHMAASRALRGKSMPVDMIVYFTALTLLVFLLFRLPPIWRRLGLEKPPANPQDHLPGAACTLLLCGLLTFSAPWWAGASHTFSPGGVNWAAAWPALTWGGAALALVGAALLFWPRRRTRPVEANAKATP